MFGYIIDGNDLFVVYKVVKEVVDCGCRGEGLILIEIVLYCLIVYFSDDDDCVYCDKEEVEEVKKKDLIIIFVVYLKEVGVLIEELEK